MKFKYLLNGKIVFCVDFEERYIEHGDLKEQLQLKEAQILKYMIDNMHLGAIPSKQILDANWNYWSDKKVLQKVLSNLRRKFKKIGCAENGFVAIGADYTLNYHCEAIESSLPIIPQNQDKSHNINRLTVSIFVSVLSLAILLIVFAPFNGEESLTLDKLTLSSPIEGISSDPSLSPDGKVLAFTYRTESPKRRSQIVLSRIEDNKFIFLTNQHTDQSPSWSPSGTKIAFQRRTPQSCKIMVVQLENTFDAPRSVEQVAQCSEHTSLTSITWATDDIFFFTNREEKATPYNIVRVDMRTMTSTPYFTYDKERYSGIGSYFISYSPHNESLYSLSSMDSRSTTFDQILDNNSSEKIKAFDFGLWGIGITKEQAVFIDLNNEIKAFLLNSPHETSTVFPNPIPKIAFPTISANGQRIALISGNTYRQKLQRMDISSKQVSDVFTSLGRITSPKSVNGKIYYQSSVSGVHQIFLHKTGVDQAITNFSENRRVLNFSVSENERWLAIDFVKGTELFELKEDKVILAKSFPSMHNPAFSLENSRIILAKQSDDKVSLEQGSELIEFKLDGMIESGISIKNAHIGIYHKHGIVFVSNSQQINLFQLKGSTNLSNSLVIKSPNQIALSENSIIAVSEGKLLKIDLENNTSSILYEDFQGEIDLESSFIYFNSRTLGNSAIYTARIESQ